MSAEPLNRDVTPNPDGWAKATLHTRKGPRHHYAVLPIGPFCVHLGLGLHRGQWTFSHLATGMWGRHFPRKVDAVQFTRALLKRLEAGGFEDTADPKELVLRIHAIVPPSDFAELAREHLSFEDCS